MMKTIKYSRQRESIKACLAGRVDHPTADVIYADIRRQFPHVSLGTVYRNLNLLAELGEIQKLSCGDGKDHFDWDTSPHYHFVCKRCGSVLDLPLKPLEGLEAKAREALEGEVHSHMVFFYGACQKCLEQDGDEILSKRC